LRRVVRASATPRIVGLLAAVAVVTLPGLAFAAGTAALHAREPSTAIADALTTAAYCGVIGLVLVRLEERLHARRRDAPFALVLLVLALGAAFATIAVLPVAPVTISLVSIATWGLFTREPEVPLADDA
ncbi:MAG: hypothetical protein ABI175_02540, partial [Polyangiales bacterium]